jgi:hypothetical protein
MKNTVINYLGQSNIYLLDNFFTAELAEQVLSIFDNIDDTDWPDTEVFSHRAGRRLYRGKSKIVDQIVSYAASSEILKEINGMLGRPVIPAGISLWADFEGYTISPHQDPDFFDYAVQIYMSRESAKWNGPILGTTIYQTPDKILLQLPYRNNFGYFFEKPGQVLHGLATPVPPGMQRNSVYLRYNRA